MQSIPEKKCTSCGETKIIHEFYMRNRHNDHTTQCKSCMTLRCKPKTVEILRKTAIKGNF